MVSCVLFITITGEARRAGLRRERLATKKPAWRLFEKPSWAIPNIRARQSYKNKWRFLNPIVQVRKPRHQGVMCPVSHGSHTEELGFKPREWDCNAPLYMSQHCQAGWWYVRQDRVEAARKQLAWTTERRGESSQEALCGPQKRSRAGEGPRSSISDRWSRRSKSPARTPGSCW